MLSHQDRYVHEISPERISEIIQYDAWKVNNQSITSSVTNENDLNESNMQWMELGENTSGINAFFDINFSKNVKKVLDVGGGKYDINRHYMLHEKNIDLLVWDPFNRSQDHNDRIRAEIMKNKADATTSMSVLNVISELEVRLAHISTLKAALTMDGKAYFKIWPGEQPLRGSYLPSYTTEFYQANSYAARFLREVEMVFGVGNVKINKSIPNLIVAEKKTEGHTGINEIARIQKKSEKELLLWIKIKEHSIKKLYFNENIIKLFSNNFSLFKKIEDRFIEKNRNNDRRLQQEYDKRFGLVVYKK